MLILRIYYFFIFLLMFKKFFLPSILLVLIYWFWISPEFKEISAGVAIFLFWMMYLEQWFKAFTWWTLEKILQNSTNKTWKSLLFGFFSATIMQSSSLVSLLAISFLSAELITLIQWIWIIFWANIGTTTWAWLIAAFWMKINISLYAMPMLVFWIIFSFQKSKALKWIWSILAWLGFLFLWIHYMKEWFEAFQNSIQLIDYSMEWFIWILVFVWIWILATIVMQSSHATIILVIAALATGQVTYENALSLVVWANIGTTITAILWSLTSNINGKRLAISDVLFKVSTWLLFIIFMPFISIFVDVLWNFIWIGADNYTLKVALFHTLFNISWLIIVIPFMSVLIKTVTRIFPDKDIKNINSPLYLNESVLDFPDTALVSLSRETRNLYDKSIDLILDSFWLKLDELWAIEKNDDLLKKIKILEIESIDDLYNKKIKNLYGEILDFITNAQALNSKKYYNNFYKIKSINIKIVQNIKILLDLQKNILKYSKSSNSNIKDEYNKIIIDLIYFIKDINKIVSLSNYEEKILYTSELELLLDKNNKKNNKNIDKLIRGGLITNEMTSSLINDNNNKNLIIGNIFDISQTIFIDKISNELNENWTIKLKKIDKLFDNTFWISDKKIDKLIKKITNKKYNLKQKLNREESIHIKNDIKEKIEIIDYTIEKYRN